MTPEKCPGCGAKLSPEMLACPNCPMSFPEDDSSPGMSNPLKQSRYWQFVLPVAFFGAIGAVIWYMGMGLFHLGEESAKSLDEKPNFMRSTAEEKKAAADAEERAARKAAGEVGPAPNRADETTSISITPVDQAPGGTAVPAPSDEGAETAKPRAAVKEWKLRGTVYDLVSLKPLSGCRVTFVDEESNRRVQTRTDASGRYRAIVPPLDGRGYMVTLSKDGYAASALAGGTDDYRSMDAAKRKSEAADLASRLGDSPTSVMAESAEPLVTDFYLAPRR